MGVVGFIMHMKKGHFWNDFNLLLPQDLTKIKKLLSNTGVVESSTKERGKIMWKSCRLRKVTTFAALLKEFPMGCKDAVLPDPLLKNPSVKCLQLMR